MKFSAYICLLSKTHRELQIFGDYRSRIAGIRLYIVSLPRNSSFPKTNWLINRCHFLLRPKDGAARSLREREMEDGERGERENRKIETGIYANRSTSPRRGSRRASGERCAEVSFRSILFTKECMAFCLQCTPPRVWICKRFTQKIRKECDPNFCFWWWNVLLLTMLTCIVSAKRIQKCRCLGLAGVCFRNSYLNGMICAITKN